MRAKLLAGPFIAILFAGSVVAGVVVEKRSRQLPDTAVLDPAGVHSFVFRGPTGTSRPPITVPPREYWTAQESGLYSFVLRYENGNSCSRMVTPEVFARYRIGDAFYDRGQTLARDKSESDDSKTMQPVVHHRHKTAQVRHRKHGRALHRALAKHQRHHHSKRLAQR